MKDEQIAVNDRLTEARNYQESAN